MADNSVTLVGNVTRDPELRYTAGGAAKVVFGLAVNRRWQNRQTQEWEEQVSFFNVVAWREMAENVAESVAKGSRVVVTGRLEQRSWETENGEKRTVVEVSADDIGPSLRWATAQITRNERKGGGDFGGGGQSGGGGGQSGGGGGQSGGGQSGGGSAPAPNSGGSGGGYDDLGEEPF
jgi:single-strand DNA-binding protein